MEKQKNRRLVELLIQECILNTIRSNIPIEEIIRSYMDETTETDVIEKIEEEVVQEKIDLKTLEKEMEEVRQNELVAVPKIEKIIEPQRGGDERVENNEVKDETDQVKDLIESMKQDSDILKNVQSPPTTPPSNSQDDVGSDSDTDSIVFDNDDEISLSGFDIQEL